MSVAGSGTEAEESCMERVVAVDLGWELVVRL